MVGTNKSILRPKGLQYLVLFTILGVVSTTGSHANPHVSLTAVTRNTLDWMGIGNPRFTAVKTLKKMACSTLPGKYSFAIHNCKPLGSLSVLLGLALGITCAWN